MSCWIVNEKPLAALADFIAALMNGGFNAFGMEAPDSLPQALYNIDGPECYRCGFWEPEPIYDALHAVNVAAYTGRYSHNPEALEEVEQWEKYQPNPRHEYHSTTGGKWAVKPWHYEMDKRLACYLYQITEDATYKTPIYNALRDLQHTLRGYIVCNTPEWDKYKWGE